jgi:hypothetical protein
MSGYVNKQNCQFWAANNLRELHQHPLYSVKLTVWYAISSTGIISPYFFVDKEGQTVTVGAEQYMTMLEIFL